MQRLLSILVALVWSLWLGGIVTVFLAVTSLFRNTFPADRETAGTAAAGIFALFERYQLGLAAAALLLSFLWRMTGGATGLKNGLFGLFAVATIVAVIQTMYISPQIDRMRVDHQQTDSAEFKSLHGKSMMHYSGVAVLLLICGFVVVPAIRADGGSKWARAGFSTPDKE